MRKNRESFWAAGAAALTMHSLAIFACALGMGRFSDPTHQMPKLSFCAEMVFTGSSPDSHFPNPTALRGLCEEPKNDKEDAPTPSSKLSREYQPKKAQQVKQMSMPALNPSFSGITPSLPIYAPAPIYPLEARRKKIQGIVLVRLFLTKTGKVHKAIPLPPRVGPILEEAALTAVHTWRFKPGTQAVEVPIEFKLGI